MDKEEVKELLDKYNKSFTGTTTDIVRFLEREDMKDKEFVICTDNDGYDLAVWTVFY